MEFTIKLNADLTIFVMCDMDGNKVLTVNCLDDDTGDMIDWDSLSNDEQLIILDKCDELYLSMKEDINELKDLLDFDW